MYRKFFLNGGFLRGFHAKLSRVYITAWYSLWADYCRMIANAARFGASSSSGPLSAEEHAEVVSAPAGRLTEDTSPIEAVWFFAERNLWLVVLCALIGVLVAGSLSLQRAVHYTAKAELLFDPAGTRTFGFAPESGMLGSDNMTLATPMRIDHSRDVLRAAVERIGVTERFAYGLPSATTSESAWNPVLEPLPAPIDNLANKWRDIFSRNRV